MEGWRDLWMDCVCVCVFGALIPFFAEVARLFWESRHEMRLMHKTGLGWHEADVVERETFARCPSALQMACHGLENLVQSVKNAALIRAFLLFCVLCLRV